MPHITLKMYPGRTEDVKKSFTKKLTDLMVSELPCSEGDVSIVIEEVIPENWVEKVVVPEVENAKGKVYKNSNF